MALVDVEDQLRLGETTDDLLDMFSVLLHRLGEHHDVVDEYPCEVKSTQKHGHDPLEVRRQRLQTERCASELILDAVPGECCLVAILDRDRKAVVCLPQVQRSENLCSSEGLEDLDGTWKWPPIVGEKRVEMAVVMADTEIRLGAVRTLLRYHEERRVELRVRLHDLDNTVVQPCFELGVDDVALRIRQRILTAIRSLAVLRGKASARHEVSLGHSVTYILCGTEWANDTPCRALLGINLLDLGCESRPIETGFMDGL